MIESRERPRINTEAALELKSENFIGAISSSGENEC
jgi:hypothetical protein